MSGLGRRSHYRKHLTDAVLNDLPEPDESNGQRIARVIGTRGGNMFDVIVAPLSSSLKSPENENLEQSGSVSNNDNVDGEDSSDRKFSGISASPASTKEEKPPSSTNDSSNTINAQVTTQLAFLPTKFRKLVWIKRNDFVIVGCGDEDQEEQIEQQSVQSGFRFVISHILYKDQVKHIKTKGLWPSDPLFADEEPQSSSNMPDGNLEQTNIQKSLETDLGGVEIDSENGDYEDDEQHYRDNDYDDNGIVFDDPLADDIFVNTNRIATLRVDDSSDSDDE